MPDFRAFSSTTERSPSTLKLSPEESHHLVVVNRARRGDIVVAFDGRGTEWTCELSTDSKREAVLAVNATRQARPLPFEITLAQALPKGQSMDAIVRKATEIGARRIIPVESERTQVHLDGDRSDKKTGKWQVAALEAAKQCGNPWLPEITPITKFADVIADAAIYDLKLIASLNEGAKTLKAVLSDFQATRGCAPKKTIWLIGPEGDFSPDEMRAALAAGIAPVSLGPLVLRCETAAVYALSVLSHELHA